MYLQQGGQSFIRLHSLTFDILLRLLFAYDVMIKMLPLSVNVAMHPNLFCYINNCQSRRDIIDCFPAR